MCWSAVESVQVMKTQLDAGLLSWSLQVTVKSAEMQNGTLVVSFCRESRLDFAGGIKSWRIEMRKTFLLDLKGRNSTKKKRQKMNLKTSNRNTNEPECGVFSVAFNGDGFNLGATLRHKPGQIFNDFLGFHVHWGGDFKQPISTGTQFTLYYCTVLNWPSLSTSLELIGNKKRKREEEQGWTGLVNGEIFGCEAFSTINKQINPNETTLIFYLYV